MSLIIGILGRPNEGDKRITFSKAIIDVIANNDCIPMGIMPPITNFLRKVSNKKLKKLYFMIDMCDGIILQGGSDYYDYDIEAVKYILKNDIPLLGICLGMQSIGVALGGNLIPTPGHNQPDVDFVHPVIIDKSSKLFQIVKSDKILVNSRHKEMIVNPINADISSRFVGVIESIERKDKVFCIGVQWHPEDMVKYDEYSIKLFRAFFKACRSYKLHNM
jgi:gamma-glutamyl-gamma-aminobutyrate hydrolase PuuD